MSDLSLRSMRRDEWSNVAELIYDSTNAWYLAHGRTAIFTGPRSNAELFCDVYEALDPGCCLLAEDLASGRLAGSCFYHPRPTHVSLGIMNVHPDFFGRGVARKLLEWVVAFADAQHTPMRLVSSAVNLDSFSLYNRAGFIPRMIYQDMTLKVPSTGVNAAVPGRERARVAVLDDVPRMAALELELNHIQRESDLRHFVENRAGIWHVSVLDGTGEALDGFLVSVAHPASNMLGPGVARSEELAVALIAAELDHHRGRQPVWLVPSQCENIVKTMYDWGAKNCELHFAQSRGAWAAPTGVVMPTFMPESG